MFSIYALAKLRKYRSLILIGLCLLATIIATGIFFKIQHFLTEQKTIAKEKAVTTLRLQAIKAQSDGDLATADKLYTQALSEAETSGASMRSIEFLSRLAQIKIKNHKLGQAHDLAERAIKLAMSIKDTNASDSNLDVWMDDLANAFYKRGEHSTRDDVKLYCLKHYVDIKLFTANSFDPLLVSNLHLITQYLARNGQLLESGIYGEKYFRYAQKMKSSDSSFMAGAYAGLGHTYLDSHKYSDAESAFKQCFLLRKSSNNPGDEIELNFHMGLTKDAVGDLIKARDFYKKAYELEKKAGWLVCAAHYASVLAYTEERLGNLSQSAELFKESLGTLQKCLKVQPKITPMELYEPSEVFAAEHLANIESQQGNFLFAKSLRTLPKEIRKRNPYWGNFKDLDHFYVASGTFPQPLPELIPTHFTLSDLNTN